MTISQSLAAFIKALESREWDADTHLEHPLSFPLEDSNATPEERENTIVQELQASTSSKRVLIVKVSHIGGHKYAGNVIVNQNLGSFPTSSNDSDWFFFFWFATDLHSVWVWNLVWPSHTARRGFHRFQHNY